MEALSPQDSQQLLSAKEEEMKMANMTVKLGWICGGKKQFLTD